MEFKEWEDNIIETAETNISYRQNMSESDTFELINILSNYLNEGINVLKKHRKMTNNDEFLSGMHDTALVQYLIDRYLVSGRDIYETYNSGGVNSKMAQSPISRLKGSCSQVM